MDLNDNSLNRQCFPELKVILFSGERITASDLAGWFDIFDQRIRLVNLWGTSETTLAKTAHFICKSNLQRERIPVGKPIRGAGVLVLDEQGELCEPLISGELFIRTPFRSFGYYNDPQANSERFIQNPFTDNDHDLIHKTGDIGRIMLDGTIDLLGRNDRQIKIHGIRVELEEIESVMNKHPRVKEVVVTKKQLSLGNDLLCAYISETNEHQTGEVSLLDTIRDYLSGKLPGYMVPGKFITLKEIPRTPNGKVDYQRLPDPMAEKSTDVIPPRSQVERKLHDIWSALLQIDPIGINQNFFELGGNSLKLMTLISLIHKEFEVRVPLADIFNNSTIEKQARYMQAAGIKSYIPVDPVEQREYYPLSPAQKRLFFLHQLDPGQTTYNVYSIRVLEGKLQVVKLQEVFRELIKRHEGLRTSFRLVQDNPIQFIHHQEEFNLVRHEANEQKAKEIVNRFIQPFDLTQAPLLRVGIIKLGEQQHILMADMHHIMADGVSAAILVKEFMVLYAGQPLPDLKIQYKDYSVWQAHPQQKKAIKAQEEYWLKEFSGKLPVLNLPMDYPRPPVQDFAGDAISFQTNNETTQGLKNLARQEDVTLYMLSLAIFILLLHKLTGQEDIIIGTDTAGRGHADLQNVIGMFVNTLALRTYPRKENSFQTFLRQIKQKVLNAFENQNYPFEELVEQVNSNRDLSRNPLFDVAFYFFNINMSTADIPEIKIPGLTQGGYGKVDKTSKFDMTLMVHEGAHRLSFTIEYRTKIFQKEKIEVFAILYQEIAAVIVENPGIKPGEIESSLALLAAPKKEEVNPDELDF